MKFSILTSSLNVQYCTTNFLCAFHRVDRVLSFFSSRPIWDSPTNSPAGDCGPPPVGLGGGGAHSLAGEGEGESQFREEGIHCGTLYICVLCVSCNRIRSKTCPRLSCSITTYSALSKLPHQNLKLVFEDYNYNYGSGAGVMIIACLGQNLNLCIHPSEVGAQLISFANR
jgi:hypothetical protein